MPSTVDAVLLLGWMQHDEAVAYLRSQCVFDPALTDEQAASLWLSYKQKVEALPARNVVSPTRYPIPGNMIQHVQMFKARFLGPEVIDVICINPSDLLIYQLLVVTNRAEEHSNCKGTWGKKFLVIDRPGAQLPCRFENGVLKLTLPHAEHVVVGQPDGALRIQQMAGFVSAAEIQGRMFLKAGYHRCFGFCRSTMMAPEARDRSVVLALTKTLPPQLMPNFPDQGLRTTLLGDRPPLFADFFDSNLTIAVKVRKKQFEAHIAILAVDEP